MLLPALLLAIALAACAYFVRNDAKTYRRFMRLSDTRARQRTLVRWTRKAFLHFLLLPLAGLALLGRVDAIWFFPREFGAAAMLVPGIEAPSPGALGIFAGAVAAGGILGGLIAARRRQTAPPKALNVEALIPRNRSEALRVALLGAHAALSEEICFRLYLPLLIALLGAPAWTGFAASALIFGAMHRYQGWLGVMLTGALGAGFAYFYLASGGLVLPMVLHLLLNWNGLLLRPAVKALARRRSD